MGFLVEYGGLLTTVQDRGRTGFQRLGVSVSGAVDRRSLAAANFLVGNREGDAALEATLVGPTLVFTGETIIAVAGAHMQPKLNNIPLPLCAAVRVRDGDRLTFGNCLAGCRCYIAFAGGLSVPAVMGSRSTDCKAGIGGVEGRALQKGDRIELGAPAMALSDLEGRRIVPDPIGGGELLLRVVLGPQDDHFTPEGIQTFLTAVYTVGRQSDRMGCRLEGPVIEHRGDGNIISDGTAFGAIQVPGNGTPIVLLADRQTTGGYPKIAGVISADLSRIAQCRGGERIRFQAVNIEQAQALSRDEREKRLEARELMLQSASLRQLAVTVNGRRYDVTVREAHEK